MFAFSTAALAFGRFTFAGRFALPLALLFGLRFAFTLLLTLPLVFPLALVSFGFRGFSFALDEVLVLRFSLGSCAGFTVSGVSPSLVGRLRSMATV